MVSFGIEESQPPGNTACGRSMVVTRDTQDCYCNTSYYDTSAQAARLRAYSACCHSPARLPSTTRLPPQPQYTHPPYVSTAYVFMLVYHNLRQFKIPGGTIVFRPADNSASTNAYLYDNDWDQVLHTYVVEEGYTPFGTKGLWNFRTPSSLVVNRFEESRNSGLKIPYVHIRRTWTTQYILLQSAIV